MNTMNTTNVYQRLYTAIKQHSGMEDEDIIQAGQHGADTGWPRFTWTKDCQIFYLENKEDIWELFSETAFSMGHKNTMELVEGFNRKDMADTASGFETLLAWFTLEEVGHWLESQQEESND